MNAPRYDGRPISVCLLISSLEFGGAERQVIEMTRAFDRTRVNPVICSLSREVPLAASLTLPEADLVIVERRGRYDFSTVLRVARLLRQRKVDVVHAFLLDAEIAARLAAPLAGVPVVVASERNTDYTRPLFHRLALRLTQPLFDVMIANSHAGKAFNVRTMGLTEGRIEVVHNGVDTERFHPDHAAGLAFRKTQGIPATDPVIAMVASFKRQKGHDCFLKMARQVARSFPNAWFLVVGGLVEDDFEASSRYAAEIRQLAASLDLGERCRFVGNQKQMEAVYNGCDLTALLSLREGTPNVLLESMACGVPVLASDAADNAILVQDGVTGCILAKDDYAGAARRAVELLSNRGLRNRMGEAARRHVCQEYSISMAATRTEDVYRRCLEGVDSRHRSPRRPRVAMKKEELMGQTQTLR
ncbi:MAG: glycosyltransferase [Verrucomicrobia bacterium]|nr:glycosyltransferase [Verrucomicrobiota bacterium]